MQLSPSKHVELWYSVPPCPPPLTNPDEYQESVSMQYHQIKSVKDADVCYVYLYTVLVAYKKLCGLA